MKAVVPKYILHFGGSFSLLAYLLLMQKSWEQQYLSIQLFLALLTVAWASLLIIFALSKRSEVTLYTTTIIVWAVLFRIVGFVALPLYEDDHFRYLWDGRTFALSGNPYSSSPIESFADTDVPATFQDVLDNINNPEIPTVYGPVSQVVFLAAHTIYPGSLLALKLLLLLADLIALFCLARLLPTRGFLLYAWCPLLIFEVSFNAHIDIVGVAFLAIALLNFQFKKYLFVSLALACSFATKPIAVLIAPFLLRSAPLRYSLLFLGGILALYSPFIFQDGHAGLDSTLTFLKDWEFNSSLFGVLKLLTPVAYAKLICVLLFLLFYTYYFLSRKPSEAEPFPRGDLVFGMFFICSAVVNPWYLLWMLPFVAIVPNQWSIAALALVTLSYAHGLTLPYQELFPYEHPLWLRPIEYGLVFLVLGWGFLVRSNSREV